MIDTLKISKRITAEELQRLPDILDSCFENINRKTGEITYSGEIRNLKVFTNGDWLNICGSLPKFINGNNCLNLRLADIRRGFAELSEILNIDLSGFIVRRFDVGFTFEMDHHPALYMQMVRHYPRGKRNLFKDGEETVQFSNESVTIHFYDKAAEMTAKSEKIPAGVGQNLLRFEWQQKKYPERILGRLLTVADLQDSEVWSQLLKGYKDRYTKIGKGVSYAGVKMDELTRKVKAVSCE